MSEEIALENENVIEWFLEKHPWFELENAARYIDAQLVDDQGYLKTAPHRDFMDGVFAARMINKKE